MKRLILILTSIVGLAMVQSCVKSEPNPDNSDYFRNKIIHLRIENIEMNDGDVGMIKMSAVRVGEGPHTVPRVRVNGEEIAADFFLVTQEMLLSGPVNIETIDSAWQYVIDYNFTPDATPFTLIYSPSFNGVVQEPIYHYIDKTKSGILEIKEYK